MWLNISRRCPGSRPIARTATGRCTDELPYQNEEDKERESLGGLGLLLRWTEKELVRWPAGLLSSSYYFFPFDLFFFFLQNYFREK
jgi:hypothetical protein